VGKTENQDGRHEPDSGFERKYLDRLRIYGGLREIPPDVSPPNKAVIVIAGICISSICYLATVRAPLYAYGCVVFLSITYCAFAVWREKHVKKQHTDSS
jgi:hypothetical protein